MIESSKSYLVFLSLFSLTHQTTSNNEQLSDSKSPSSHEGQFHELPRGSSQKTSANMMLESKSDQSRQQGSGESSLKVSPLSLFVTPEPTTAQPESQQIMAPPSIVVSTTTTMAPQML